MYKLITTLDELKSLEPEWNALANSFTLPMVQFDWFFNCAKFLCTELQLRIFLVYSEDKLTAIAPLVQVNYRFSRWLEIMGASSTYEPSGLLYKDERSLTLLLKSIFKYGLPVNFQRISHSSLELDITKSTKIPLRLFLQRGSASSHHIDPDSDWDLFLIKSKKKWSKKTNNAKRLGDIQIEFICPNKDNLKKYFKEAMDVEFHSWKGEQSTALVNNDDLRKFFESYFSRLAEKNSLYFAFYRLDGQAIAMHTAGLYNNKIWSYKIGYDSSFSRISPGMLLTFAVLNEAFKNGQSYEFLGSAESWQKVWPVKEHRYCSIIIYPLSLNGILGFIDTFTSVLRNKFYLILHSLMHKK